MAKGALVRVEPALSTIRIFLKDILDSLSGREKKIPQEQAVQEMFIDRLWKILNCSFKRQPPPPPPPSLSGRGQSYPGPLSIVITYEVSILIMVSTQHFRLVCHVMNPLLITYPGISVTA